MMEFTFDGHVRHGFGFYNPNHAAALLCAVFPFLWNWKRVPVLGWLLSVALTVPLALTYSRTGILVLAFELVAFFFFSRQHSRRVFFALFAALLAVTLLVGVGARFTLDRAVLNRPEIWLAGLKLAAVNPLGVGFGHSGELASTFLLDGIVCRTLVNSHLTLLVEFGLLIGFLWFLFIVSAIVCGSRQTSAWCAFAGLTLSAFAASVFDWGVLFDFRAFGDLPLLNFVLSWATFLLYLALGARLLWRRVRRARLAVSVTLSLVLALASLAFSSPDTPRVRSGSLIKGDKDAPLVLLDGDWTMRTAHPFLKDAYRIPLDPKPPFPPAQTVWLFGAMAEYAPLFPSASLVFVSPPEFFDLPPNTKKVYLKKFAESRDADFPTTFY